MVSRCHFHHKVRADVFNTVVFLLDFLYCICIPLCRPGLFCSTAHVKMIAQHQIEGFKKNKVTVVNKLFAFMQLDVSYYFMVLTCMMLAFTANADGSEKLPPFFIGNAKNVKVHRSRDDAIPYMRTTPQTATKK